MREKKNYRASGSKKKKEKMLRINKECSKEKENREYKETKAKSKRIKIENGNQGKQEIEKTRK